jgi:hypothetical protein
MLSGTNKTEDSDIIVPYEGDQGGKKKFAIKITPIEVETDEVEIETKVLEWIRKPNTDDESDKGGKYYTAFAVDKTVTTEELKEMARQELTPLVKIEIFTGYEYYSPQYDKDNNLIQKEYLKLDETNPFYSDSKYWTQSKLKQHGFLTEAPNLMWQ